MTKRMLIDAAHKEETRVAILNNNKLEEFLYESALRKPLKGNIFLAKVTRVEPSLQAAFVNYGGNRHGFLPFSEIHPDYFRIPVADQEEFEAMQREQLEEHDKYAADDLNEDDTPEEEASDDSEDENNEDAPEEAKEEQVEEKPKKKRGRKSKADKEAEEAATKAEDEKDSEPSENEDETASDEEATDDNENKDDKNNNRGRGRGRGRHNNNRGGRGRGGNNRRSHGAKRPENFGDDEAGQQSRFRFNLRRKYKIQEVIKRGQIMLIQVSREERGNKGAAVTSYLSLPGRYCVLMPNSPRGGGVSRKISNYKDRSKMKDLLSALEVPAGMSTIVRTAGVTRTKTEVKRDLDYLMRLWNSIRELTLKSSAPSMVYEEADLIKRSVRDLYTRDIEEVLVAGEEAHKISKDFMKMLMPSHAKKIKLYTEDDIPLFQRYQAEQEIAAIGETEVTLPSGGYLVINPTEALVSIDVNSGRSTKERNIEGTALKTNLEAADEVARQLRLRDLGGLVVIDFIDMEHRGNNGKVERRIRDALADDKARIQTGRISSFGLMELSRQRLSASLSESQYETCSHCEGRGLTRTADATSLLVLRAIEAEGVKKRAAQIIAHVPANVALYILNYKRAMIGEIEERYNIQVLIRVDDDIAASNYRVEVSRPIDQDDEDSDAVQSGDNTQSEETSEKNDDDNNEKRGRNRRGGRNRGGRGRNRNNQDNNNQNENSGNTVEDNNANEPNGNVIPDEPKDIDGNTDKKPSRRGRSKSTDTKKVEIVETKAEETKSEDKPAKKKPAAKKPSKKDDEKAVEPKDADEKGTDKKKPAAKKKAPAKKKEEASNDDTPKAEEAPKEYEVVNEAPKKKKKGWWSKG